MMCMQATWLWAVLCARLESAEIEVSIPPLGQPSHRSPPRVDAIRLRSDAEVQRARNDHAALLMMVEHRADHGCKLAAEMFERAASQWSAPGNVTFARIDMDVAPTVARDLGARMDNGVDGLPKYALSLAGLPVPIKYSGGWSEASLGKWLHQQLALKPVDAGQLLDVARIARQNKHGVAVVGLLTDAQRKRRLLELAARTAQVHATVVHGDSSVAGEMALDVPCVVVVSHDASERWAVLRPPLTQQAVERFLWRRALPLVVHVGDHKRDFAAHVRGHAHESRLQAILVHISGARGPDDESESALAELHRAARQKPHAAMYVAYDFFDNDPEQFVAHGIYASELPTLLLIQARGRPEERVWRLSESQPIRSRAVIELIEKATIELAEDKALIGAPSEWEEHTAPGSYEEALDVCEAADDLG